MDARTATSTRAQALYDGYAADGYSHRGTARYELVSEPDPKAEVLTDAPHSPLHPPLHPPALVLACAVG